MRGGGGANQAYLRALYIGGGLNVKRDLAPCMYISHIYHVPFAGPCFVPSRRQSGILVHSTGILAEAGQFLPRTLRPALPGRYYADFANRSM